MNEVRSNLIVRIQKALAVFVSLFTGWALLLLLMRIAEWLLNGFIHEFPAGAAFIGWALLTDLFFLGSTGLLMLVLFLLISLASIQAARIVFFIIALLLTFGYFALLQYFSSTTVLLGADLYGYSLQDIQQTIGASGGLNWKTITLILLLIAGVVVVFYFTGKKIRPGYKIAVIAAVLIALTGIVSLAINPLKPSFKKEYDNDLAENKLDFFLRSSWTHFFPDPFETDIYSDAYTGDYGDAGSGTSVSFNYPDEANYPFLRLDSSADVLSPFLKPATATPDIVMIIIEGMGRAFSNEGAYLGSFTPFLDSLSQQSLYWENFLSGGGRTFAVLPTVLGSLPFEKNGFNENRENMPPHLSLASILKRNGYQTSFFYAGDASFDNMDIFMQKQSIDLIKDRKTFPAGYPQMPANNGFSWGYGDKELYRYSLEQTVNNTRPSLQVILTVATHSPFLINDQPYYEQLARQRMATLQLSSAQQEEHNKYIKQYSTVMYADDALRSFIKDYSKKPNYNNTIFIITGDHRMPEIPMVSKIDRYHVPLLIYSPLLQRPARFQSVSSHFDITPSVIGYLKRNYGLNAPSLSAWVGSGLDTARSFRNIHATPLMQTKTDLIDFVMGNYHLNGTDLFRLNSSLGEEKIVDEAVKEGLLSAFNRFRQKNDQLQQQGKLIPDSLMKNYHP
ncbi:LTA synthase family protein [Terrimonas sp. NA20]|uniref:LTA synthase family protein n=1 Tax=Terrimonas ginsenosidimutans TaxID=2908004 RepID=A0ABS9KUR9_9BACT|nr:LTA synthase family protein [Terrimonas ginsenosidimutans]MCG2616033.1 LTA synthase family protein [Terrimonas ginsenosidimutans]